MYTHMQARRFQIRRAFTFWNKEIRILRGPGREQGNFYVQKRAGISGHHNYIFNKAETLFNF